MRDSRGRTHDGGSAAWWAREGRAPWDCSTRSRPTTAAATEAAKDAAAKGQAKFDEVQAKKAADGILRDLGAAFYATKTGRSTPDTEAEIERLITAMQEHEAEHGQVTLAPESAAGGPTASPTDSPASAPPPPPQAADPASPPPPPPSAQTL